MGILKSVSRTVVTAADMVTDTLDSATKVVAVMNNKAQLYHDHCVDVDTENSALNTLNDLERIQNEIGDDPKRMEMFERIMARRQKASLLSQPE